MGLLLKVNDVLYGANLVTSFRDFFRSHLGYADFLCDQTFNSPNIKELISSIPSQFDTRKTSLYAIRHISNLLF